MKAEIEVSLSGIIRIDIPESKLKQVKALVFPMELEDFETASGVTIDWDDVFASAPCDVNGLHFSKPTKSRKRASTG